MKTFMMGGAGREDCAMRTRGGFLLALRSAWQSWVVAPSRQLGDPSDEPVGESRSSLTTGTWTGVAPNGVGGFLSMTMASASTRTLASFTPP